MSTARTFYILRASGYLQGRSARSFEKPWDPKTSSLLPAQQRRRHRFLESCSFFESNLKPQEEVIDALYRLRPVILLQDEFTKDGQFISPQGVIAKNERIRPALRQHDSICADENAVCIYTDASVKDMYVGAAAWIPTVDRVYAMQVGRIDLPRRSIIGELYGVVLGLEVAARFAKPGQRVAIFSDAMLDRLSHFDLCNSSFVYNACKRAAVALKTLQSQDSWAKVYWIPGHREIIGGMITVHRAARKAVADLMDDVESPEDNFSTA